MLQVVEGAEEEDTGIILIMILIIHPMDLTMGLLTLPMEAMVDTEEDMVVVSVCVYTSVCACVSRACVCVLCLHICVNMRVQ